MQRPARLDTLEAAVGRYNPSSRYVEEVLAKARAYGMVEGGDTVAGLRRQMCIDRLPQYMRPREVFHLPQLPKSANGKVDQHRLVREAGSRRPHRMEDT